jgi:hypothetical protein
VNLTPFYTGVQQRLGFVNAIITLTSPDSFTSRENLGNRLYKLVEPKQDFWLKQCRSTTGAVTIRTANDLVDFATNLPLELLFPSTFSWRPEARIIENLISDQEYDAFETSASYNPLELSLPERLFYLYKFLVNDGIAFVHIMSGLRTSKNWTRTEAAVLLQESYEIYGKKLKSLVQSSSDYAEAQGMLTLAEKMEHGREGVVGTKELRVTPRLEALVDLHIIDKPDEKKGAYVYCRTDRSNRFVQEFNDVDEEQTSIENDFFGRCAHIYGIGVKPIDDPKVFRALINNSQYVRAAYGLVGINEVSLLTAIRALTAEPAGIVELPAAREILIENQKEHQNDIKLHVDTKGRIRYFSVSKDFLAKSPS